MMSLKAFAPVLASTLGTTPAAIYERQRALIRAHLLPAPISRGRGYGLPASAETVALMIIALMVTDNLSDTDDRVQKVADAAFAPLPGKKDRCKFTGAQDFRSALIVILESKEVARAVTSIQLLREDLSAQIVFGSGSHRSVSSFGNRSYKAMMQIEAKIPGKLLMHIGSALRSYTKTA
jgi:hypothetical protein